LLTHRFTNVKGPDIHIPQLTGNRTSSRLHCGILTQTSSSH